MPRARHVAGPGDLNDLQRQVLERRDELLRAWNVESARKTPEGPIAAQWTDLASRAWDFSHELFSWWDPNAQDDRGRKLLAELYAMYQRFVAAGIGKEAMPTAPPPAPPSLDPSHKDRTLLGDLEEGAGILVLLYLGYRLLTREKRRA